MEEKALNYILENFPKKRALLTGNTLLLLLFSSLDGFFEKVAPNPSYRFSAYLVIGLLFTLYWLHQRNSLPKNKKGYVGIVISINTESKEQELRIKNDFAGRLGKLILENKLENIVNVITLNNFQAKRVSNVLSEYAKNKRGKTESKDWKEINKAINGHFFVYGEIRERKDGEDKYFLSLDALVVHKPVNQAVQNEITQDFLQVWYKQISFEEKLEFRGFEFTADSTFVAVKYIVGIAALVSGDIPLALSLHTKLNTDPYLKKFQQLPNMRIIRKRLKGLLVNENYLMARLLHTEGDVVGAKAYLEKSMSMQKGYGGLLFRAIIEFLNDNNPTKALSSVNEAKRFARNDGTWRYSEAFLLMYLEKFEQALAVYRVISEYRYDGEEFILNDVYQFNEDFIRQNPDQIQSLFILGYLKYKKDSNYAEAYSWFEKFLNKASPAKHQVLIQDAVSYKTELEVIMQIKV